jgi:hypothetical protein
MKPYTLPFTVTSLQSRRLNFRKIPLLVSQTDSRSTNVGHRDKYDGVTIPCMHINSNKLLQCHLLGVTRTNAVNKKTSPVFTQRAMFKDEIFPQYY